MGTDYTLKVRTKDLSGEVFGRLTVVSFAGYKNFRATWNCQCECGTTKEMYYVATWREPQDDGKNKPASKHFSVTKLGEDLALSLAVEYRNAQIERLKQIGINYSENHGEKWESYEQEA